MESIKRCLVTGCNGFVGKWIQQLFPQVVPAVTQRGERIDLRDRHGLEECISRTDPEWVLHLAGQSSVARALKHPQETYEINFFGTFHLLEALKAHRFKGRFLYVSSCQVYGKVPPEALPLDERQPPQFLEPYGVSKFAAEALSLQTFASDAFETLIARPFNHVGPGQSDAFVLSNFAKQFVQMKRGIQSPLLTLGNAEVTRDFSDVRDVARGYMQLLAGGRAGQVYHLCSGVERTLASVIEQLSQLTGIEVQMQEDKERKRAVEQSRFVGSYQKIKREVGWEPVIPFEQTLLDIFEYWESQLL